MDHESRVKKIILLSISLVLLLFPQANGDEGPVVLRLEGKATSTTADDKTPVSLKKGDLIGPGSQIRTEINSRMVLDYGENRHIRLDELTICELAVPPIDKKNKSNDTILRAITGNIWISISKVVPLKRRISILTAHAELQPQPDQAIFRLSVFPTDSVLVKVYQGTVTVRKKKNTARKGAASRKSKYWGYILKPMQQIFIRPDGTSTNPFQFMVKPDLSTWVLWNQSLDEERLSTRQ